MVARDVNIGANKSVTLCAIPFDISASHFYFQSVDEYKEKRNKQPTVEEFDLECIDGDAFACELFQAFYPGSLVLESRIRIRHHLDKRTPENLAHILTEALKQAGSPELMTAGVIQTVAEQGMGNLRAMMLMGSELLAEAAEKQIRQIDENLFFDVFSTAVKKKRGVK